MAYLLKIHLFFALVLSFSSVSASESFASTYPESAQAFPGETFEQAQARHSQSRGFIEVRNYSRALNANGSAYAYRQNFSGKMNLSVLPKWTAGAAKLEQAFKRARDTQSYTDLSGRKRRATWLYPQDGCYGRAAHDSRVLEKMGYPRPGKMFIFGTWATLRAKTPFAASGRVWWGYHTVAAYRLGDRAIIFDAAVDPSRLLPIEEWVGLLAPDPSKITIAVCDQNAYGPSDTCIGGTPVHEASAISHLTGYFDDEWSNVLGLNLDPFRLLGDGPPWK